MRHFRLFLFVSVTQILFLTTSTQASGSLTDSNYTRDWTSAIFRPPLLEVHLLADLGSHLSRRMATTPPRTELQRNGDLKVYFRSATRGLPDETFEHPETAGYSDSETAYLALFFAEQYIIEMGHLLNKEEIEAIHTSVVQSPTDRTFKIRFEHIHQTKEYPPASVQNLKVTIQTD